MELQTLPLSADAIALLRTSASNYQRFARLRLSVDTLGQGVAWCTAHQYEAAPGGRLLTVDEIEDRAREAFAPLAEAGYTPIICVYTVKDGGPDAPHTKHRSGSYYRIAGRRGTVLRIAPPRVLFTNRGADQEVLVAEHEGAATDASLSTKARAWARRAGYRVVAGR